MTTSSARQHCPRLWLLLPPALVVGACAIASGCGGETIACTETCANAEAGGETGIGDASDHGGTVYSALDDPSKWSSFDITGSLDAAGAGGYQSAAFDGRYLYLVPYFNNVVVRYDTLAPFTMDTSWATFDLGTFLAPGFVGSWSGAAFDGRYIYLAPDPQHSADGSSEKSGLVARYDTRTSFGNATSWSTFDTASLNVGMPRFSGAAFDGRYVYLVPGYDDLVVRYDTQAAFAADASWGTFRLTTLSPWAKAYTGAVFDGRYLHLVPSQSYFAGIEARYDTSAPFTTPASWTAFDMHSVAKGPGYMAGPGYSGGAFDGRYVYFVPGFGSSSVNGLAARYDTQAGYATVASWSTFDMTTVRPNAVGFFSGAFDGRYVYFGPGAGDYNTGLGPLVGRFDTEGDFTLASSWAFLGMVAVGARTSWFAGSAFDGRYLYFVGSDGQIMRFDAKVPPSLPPGYAHGSFY